MADRKLYIADVAELTGLTAATLRSYRRKPGLMPDPDDTDADRGHLRPWWWESTIRTWMAQRPGRGAPGRPRTRMAQRLRGD